MLWYVPYRARPWDRCSSSLGTRATVVDIQSSIGRSRRVWLKPIWSGTSCGLFLMHKLPQPTKNYVVPKDVAKSWLTCHFYPSYSWSWVKQTLQEGTHGSGSCLYVIPGRIYHLCFACGRRYVFFFRTHARTYVRTYIGFGVFFFFCVDFLGRTGHRSPSSHFRPTWPPCSQIR